MTPEMEIALEHYDAACDGLIGAETAYAVALRQYLNAERVGLLTVGGGTASERCDRAHALLIFEDAAEVLRRAQQRHRDAHRTAFELSVGFKRGGK